MPARLERHRRRVLRAAAVIGTALCVAGCGEVHARPHVGHARAVGVSIDGPAGPLYAPLYVASAGGDFAAGALAVTISSAPGGNALAALEAGSVQIAVASEPEVLAARDAGHELIVIGALAREPLEAIVSLDRSRLTSASQLAGRTVATDGTPLAHAALATVLAAARVPSRRVHSVGAPAGLPAALTARRHPAGAALGGPWPSVVATLDADGHPARVLPLTSAGVPAYSGQVIVVRLGEARHDGPVLRAFLQSLGRGERAVAANPAGAAATLTRLFPHVRAAFQRSVLARTAPLLASASASRPFGWEDADAWRTFGTWMHAHGLLVHATNAGNAVTNEFLPGQGEQVVTGS